MGKVPNLHFLQAYYCCILGTMVGSNLRHVTYCPLFSFVMILIEVPNWQNQPTNTNLSCTDWPYSWFCIGGFRGGPRRVFSVDQLSLYFMRIFRNFTKIRGRSPLAPTDNPGSDMGKGVLVWINTVPIQQKLLRQICNKLLQCSIDLAINLMHQIGHRSLRGFSLSAVYNWVLLHAILMYYLFDWIPFYLEFTRGQNTCILYHDFRSNYSNNTNVATIVSIFFFP